jgi:apolipoprotein N-acyltransferase
MYGLGLPRWVRLTVIGVYVGAILWVYSSVGYPKIHQVTWIPLTYYATALALALLVGTGLWMADRVKRV